MSVCKFDQRGSCRFGNSCKNVHQPASVTAQGHKPVTLAPCIFFPRGRCINGDTCSFAHPSSDTTGHANDTNRCRYWSQGTCNKGDACPFIHSEVGIPPTFDNLCESPVSTPILITSHTPTSDSDEVREIVDVDVQTANTEIHVHHGSSDPEGIKQPADSQAPLANIVLDSSQKLVPLPLESDPNASSHILPTSSDEECRTENPQADTGTPDPYLQVEPVSSSLGIIHEDSQKDAPLEEDTGEACPDSSPNNTPKKYEEGERTAPADGEPRLRQSVPEDISFQDGMDDREQPASWTAWDSANACGTDQSYEESLTTKRVDNSASIQQSPSYLEAAQVMPELIQNSMNTRSYPPYEQNSYMESEGQAIHGFVTSPQAPEDVPHWSQYADPLADPTTPFCKFFAQSHCNQGDACSFRHSITVNEYALLFRDPQPLLWSSGAQHRRAEHVIPSTASAFGICKFYPIGTCRNGDGCPYLHAPPPIFTPADSGPQEGWSDHSELPMPPYRNREARPCRHYMENGYCGRGDKCRFSHEVDAQNDGHAEWQNNGNKESVVQRTRSCKYFSEGNCKKGDKCTFMHDNSNTQEERGSGWGETTSNGWGETADGWGAPNADGWGEPTSDSWAENNDNNDKGTTVAEGAIGDIPPAEQSGPTEAEPRMMENKRCRSDKTTWSASGTTRGSSLCRFYARGPCIWGIRCIYRHDRANNNTPPEDSWGESSWDISPQAERKYHNGVENDAPADDSWRELPWDVTSEHCHDPVDIETPAKDSWGDMTETPWDDPVQDHSQASLANDLSHQEDGLGQTDNAQNDASSSNIHKWALTVADKSEMAPDNDDEKTWSTPWSDNVAESATPARIHAPCKAFGQGYCHKGDACRYRHIAPPDPVVELTLAEGSGTDMHEDLEAPGAQSDSGIEVAVPDVVQHLSVDRNLFNCTMCFGSGCSPTNILTACDSTRVLLSNISPTITHDDLRDIAHTFGHISDLVIGVGETSANAAIEFGDLSEAIDAVTHLDGQTYDSMIITAGLDTAATERTMRPLVSRTVKVSWAPPILWGWAYYPTITTAKAQEKRLDGWTFNGRKIKAKFHRPQPKQTHSFAVKITGLPATTDKKSLEQLCEESNLVTLGTITYDSTPVNNAICDLLANLGPLDSFDVPSWDGNQSKIVGFAQFRMDTTPLEGVMALNAVPQPFLDGASLSMQQVFHAKYSLSARHFHAVHGEIDRLGSVHKSHGSVQFYESPDRRKVVLHVYGDSKDPEKFGRFNIELQALLQGDILISEGSRVWDEYFGISSSAKALEKINADNPFFIQVDNRAQAIHVLGSDSHRQAARAIVLRLLKKVRAQRCVIPLDRFSLHGLLAGGYQALQEDVGLNKVTLDAVASELIVRGDSDVVRQVGFALNTHAPTSPNDSSGPDLLEEGMSCPVCYQKPTNSIKLSCRHVYCQTCLQHVLQTSNGLRFTPPRCVAAGAGEENEEGQQCTENIPYTIVRDLLRVDEEEQLLKASFLYHVRNHPNEYFFCPTFNCETVYGHGREGVVYQCPSCSTQICSSCRLHHHEGLTCSERREFQSVITT